MQSSVSLNNTIHKLLVAVALLAFPGVLTAQSNAREANLLLDAEQMQYKKFLESSALDPVYKTQLERFSSVVTDSLQEAFNNKPGATDSAILYILNANRYFLQTIRASVDFNQFALAELPVVLSDFPKVADAVFAHESPERIAAGWGTNRTQLMADVFRQYSAGKVFQQLADIRRVAVNANNILPFLERRPDFPFVDTALVFVAERNPVALLDYLTAKNNRITDSLKASARPLLRQLVSLAGDRNAAELAPFAAEMAEGRLTRDSVLSMRINNVPAYYQQLVNAVQRNRRIRLAGGPWGMQPALRTALHQKGVMFFVNHVNELHEAKDEVRFASLAPLRPIDLYYLLVSDEDELYTSSFLGIYYRLKDSLPYGHSDQLLSMVQYDQFRKFIRACAHYNVLGDYMSSMPDEARWNLLKDFVSNIDSNRATGLEDAMDVADAFIGLANEPIYRSMVGGLIDKNLNRCRDANSFYGVRLYGILKEVFLMVSDPVAQQSIFKKLGNYELLSVDSIRDKDNFVSQLVLFYGDDDGKASYQSFMSLFRNKTEWSVVQQPQWTEISSLAAVQPVRIYANLPLDHGTRLDEQAQKALLAYLGSMQIKPGVIVHRGHSYHLPTTLDYLQPYMKLAILGSCGGYKNLLTVAGKSPTAQIIATKQVGSKAINDPLLQQITSRISRKEDIRWPDFWTQMATDFSANPNTQGLWAEYVPPYRNLSLFVARLYNMDDASF